jgi:hypothetical protein
METWFCLPGNHSEDPVFVSRSANSFQIEGILAPGATTRITGSYLSFHTRKLCFSWNLSSAASKRSSTVDIRLCGAFDKSILRLRHRGFDFEDDVKWHAALWFGSLSRLVRLFDPPARGEEPARTRPHGLRSTITFENSAERESLE